MKKLTTAPNDFGQEMKYLERKEKQDWEKEFEGNWGGLIRVLISSDQRDKKMGKQYVKDLKNWIKSIIIAARNEAVASELTKQAHDHEILVNTILAKHKEDLKKFSDEARVDREKLAELEHEQWMSWTKYIDNEFKKLVKSKKNTDINVLRLLLSIQRRWRQGWKPYKELSNIEKDKDRVWADKIVDQFNQNIKKALEKYKLNRRSI